MGKGLYTFLRSFIVTLACFSLIAVGYFGAQLIDLLI